MENEIIYSKLSLSAYAFGYGFGFVKDNRNEAMGMQNMTLDDLTSIALKHNMGGVEVPIDKYFKGKDVEIFKSYLKSLNDSGLRLIYAFEHFDAEFFSQIAPYVKQNSGSFIRVKISNFYGGNRFKEETYSRDLNKFRNELNKSLNVLDQYKIRVLIENHQDVTLHDIFEIVEEFGINRIGINWDTGNSFPTGETIETFLKKSIHLIGNVHLKDYRIQITEGGYIMHRCALGDGVIDFNYLMSTLFDYNPKLSYTIELGAMNGREALINNELYWEYTKGIDIEQKKNLIDFVHSRAVNNCKIMSLWEQNARPEQILNAEQIEVINSIHYIQQILQNLYEDIK